MANFHHHGKGRPYKRNKKAQTAKLKKKQKVLSFKIFSQYEVTPNCALARRTTLCLYVPGFYRQTFKHAPKCQWIPLTKLPWIPRAKTCNVIFVGTFVVPRIPQHANIASCSGFRNCKWIPQKVRGIRKSKWNPQNY